VSRFALLLRRDLGDLAQLRACRWLVAGWGALAALAAVGVLASVLSPEPVATAVRRSPAESIGTLLHLVTLLPFLSFLWLAAGSIVAREKATGHLETLLATPLDPSTLWTARTAAFSLPGLLAAAAVAAPLTVAASRLSEPMGPLATLCAANVLLATALTATTVLLGLAGSPDLALLPSFVAGLGALAAAPLAAVLGLVDPGGWRPALVGLALAAAAWSVVAALAARLTKERAVLSSREE
jgi:ABC-type Na+ efflux pump permease subunit